MKPLMNPQLDQALINQNHRLSYFKKLSNGIENESTTNQQQLVKTFIDESHIPNYMYQEDAKEVQTFIRHKQSKHISSVVISLIILLASVAMVTYSQLTDSYKLFGSLAVFVASIAFSAFLIVNDRLFIPSQTLKNVKNVLNIITNTGVADE